nr:uncharacterized protein LOC112789636 [Arachis hypogaea]
MLRMRRRDKGVEGGRPRKKEEAMFVLLCPVAVRGVIVITAVRGCVTEPLSPENSVASPRFTAVAEDDASLVKQIGQSFQYSKIEERREEQIQAAHDEAMFGASALPPPTSTNSEPERENEKEVDKKAVVTSLLSETEC